MRRKVWFSILGMITLALALGIVFLLRIGPTILSLSPSHGIHEGDFIALPLLLLSFCFLRKAWDAKSHQCSS